MTELCGYEAAWSENCFKLQHGGAFSLSLLLAVSLDGHIRGSLLELILAVSLDGHIRSRVAHASEAEALAHLVVIQEGLVGLVDSASRNLAGAAGAGASTAGVRQLDALLLSLVEDVHVLRALEGLRAIRGLQGHLKVGRNSVPGWHGAHDGRRRASSKSAAGIHGHAAHVHALLRNHEGLLHIAARGPDATEHHRAECTNGKPWQHARLGGHLVEGRMKMGQAYRDATELKKAHKQCVVLYNLFSQQCHILVCRTPTIALARLLHKAVSASQDLQDAQNTDRPFN